MSDAFIYANPDLREMLRRIRNYDWWCIFIFLHLTPGSPANWTEFSRRRRQGGLWIPLRGRGRTGEHPARIQRERPHRRSIGKMPLTIEPLAKFNGDCKKRQGTTSQAAEKGLIPCEKSEKHTSVAKATIDSIDVMPGINPRPTARECFSAACSVVPEKELNNVGL